MKYNKNKAVLCSLLKAVQIEFFGFFVMLFFWAVKNFLGLFGNIMFGFTGLMCIVCIMADYGMKQGTVARERVKLHGDDVKESFGLVMGVTAMAPALLSTIILALSKAGIIGNFLPAFKIINASYFPLLDIAAHSADIADMPWPTFIMLGIFALLYLVSCHIGFKITFNQVDVKDKVVYKHDK